MRLDRSTISHPLPAVGYRPTNGFRTRRARTACALAAIALPLAISGLLLARTSAARSGEVASPAVDPGTLFLAIATSPDTGTSLAVGEQGRILRKEPGGSTWERIESPTDVLLTTVCFSGGSNVWAGGHDATLLHSRDEGRSWTLASSDPEAEAPVLDLWFEDSEHGLALGAYGLTYETFDGGASWDDREIAPEGPHLYCLTESPAGSLYVAGEFGTVLRSGDRGDTWTPLITPYGGTFFGALALADESILVFGLRGNVFRSGDGGETWSKVEVGESASLLTGIELGNGTLLLAGLAGSILESEDQGRTFRTRNRPDRLALTGLIELEGRTWISSERGIVPLEETRETTAPAGVDP